MVTSSPRVAGRLLARRLQQRLGALVVASALVGTSVPALAVAAPSQEEIGRMYGEGQEYMEQKEYKRAADVFTRLLNLIEESADNKAIRESLILNILDAHMQAYEGIVDADGNRDIEQLRTGKATLQQYYKNFQAVHGDSVAVIAEIQASATKLDQLLAEAEDAEDKAAAPDPSSDTPDPPVDNPPPVTTPPPPRQDGNAGLGFIIGGVGLGVLGVGATIMIPVGSALGNDAEDKYNEGQQELVDASGNETLEAIARSKIEQANDDGERANAVLISGAVLAPLLVGGAVALIVIGARRRQQSMASVRPIETLTAAPAVGRDALGGRFSGFTLQGRF